MITISSTTLQNDYNLISQLAHESEDPIYITMNGENDLVVMSIKAFQTREAIFDLKEKLLMSEEQRLSGQATSTLDDVYERFKGKIDG